MLGHLNILNKLLLYIWNTLCWKTIVLLSFEQGDQFYRLDCKWWYCDEVNEVYDDDEEHCRQMTLSALCWMNVGQCQHFATLALQILRSWYEMSHILILPNEKCLYRTQVSLGSGLLVPVSLSNSDRFVKLCWCYSVWWWYQLNTIDDANLKRCLAICNQCHICKSH